MTSAAEEEVAATCLAKEGTEWEAQGRPMEAGMLGCDLREKREVKVNQFLLER